MNKEANRVLNLLHKNERQWLSMAKDITHNSKVMPEDLIQDFYILVYNKISTDKLNFSEITYNSELNKTYVYKMIKNLFIDGVRKDKESRITYDLISTLKSDNEPYIDMEGIVDEIIDEFYWFDKKLFNLYRKKFHSIRKLSSATNISHVIVWRTINRCIKQIKKKINEKYRTW